MKYTHVKRDIENNISFPKEAYYYITKWERKNGEITIEDYRDSQCHGQIIVTAPENGQSITKVGKEVQKKVKQEVIDTIFNSYTIKVVSEISRVKSFSLHNNADRFTATKIVFSF